jgi:quercetin dioxygenase-like cupin family protein
MKNRSIVWIALSGFLLLPAATRAEDAAKKPTAPAHVILLDKDLKWTDAPPSLRKGPKMAVLHGDPDAAGPFAMRILLPAGYSVPPHFHPADENVTVISGTISMGVGDTADPAKAHALSAGAFSMMPAGLHHYVWTNDGAVIEVHAVGPWGITYVNPEDDPRGPPAAK